MYIHIRLSKLQSLITCTTDYAVFTMPVAMRCVLTCVDCISRYHDSYFKFGKWQKLVCVVDSVLSNGELFIESDSRMIGEG
jgi:hypothetical protein